MMRKLCCLLLAFLPLAGCQRESQSNGAGVLRNGELEQAEGGAISTAPIVVEPASAPSPPLASTTRPSRSEIDWSPLQLEHATIHVSCNLDYQRGEDVPLTDIGKESLHQALTPCAEQRLVRIRYQGKIDHGFVSVMERVTVTADELGIDKRVLDLDSAGGQVEEAIRAGDFIAESHWTIWVREGAICHSACVLILGAGDTRMIAGKVGIHRIIRMSSTASTRAELNAELNAVYLRVREYLERNGVAVAVADLMMAVPNRRLRLLTSDELHLYGLDGVNPVQDDLDRLRLMRKCGEDFVRRRDGFLRAFERRCQSDGDDLNALNECGLELRTKFGFPDSVCSAESPLSEFDLAMAATGRKEPQEGGEPPPQVSPEEAPSD
ncbi:MAG TPA: hypothetical protein VFI92_14390 [Steroidobacteraceae bacterium]|nr:hypothetical protein [Steroidobacteraceae bacterium]